MGSKWYLTATDTHYAVRRITQILLNDLDLTNLNGPIRTFRGLRSGNNIKGIRSHPDERSS
jgi:hypothetical protein